MTETVRGFDEDPLTSQAQETYLDVIQYNQRTITWSAVHIYARYLDKPIDSRDCTIICVANVLKWLGVLSGSTLT